MGTLDSRQPPQPAAGLPRVLFLCTGNSCRSQMAEGWTRHLHAGRVEAISAGTHPKGVDPMAVRVMAEAGVDISAHASKPVDPAWFQDGPRRVNLIVTVCDAAAAACPTLPNLPRGVRVLHAHFDDPPALAAASATDEQRPAHYRRVCDEIRRFIEGLPDLAGGPSAGSGVRAPDRPGTDPAA